MHTRATLAAVALAVLPLTSCALTADITTSNPYDASDGTGAVLGDVRSQNFLLVTSGEGDEAVLVGALTNDGDEAVVVTVTVGKDDVTVKVPAEGSVTLGLAEGQSRLVTTADVAPGLLTSVEVAVSGGGSEVKPLPVVDGTLPEYAAVLDQLASE